MTPSSTAFLHGAPGVEVGPLAYLVGVLAHLLVLGGVAFLVYAVTSVAGTARAALSAD